MESHNQDSQEGIKFEIRSYTKNHVNILANLWYLISTIDFFKNPPATEHLLYGQEFFFLFLMARLPSYKQFVTELQPGP